MEKVEITSMSSRGQIVIPFDLRKKIKLKEGEKFTVFGNEETIILKKLEMPSFEEFDNLINKTREFAKMKGIKKSDVNEAMKRVRG